MQRCVWCAHVHFCLYAYLLLFRGCNLVVQECKASVLPLSYITSSEFYIFVGYYRGDTSTLPTEVVVTALAIPSQGLEGCDRCWSCRERSCNLEGVLAVVSGPGGWSLRHP